MKKATIGTIALIIAVIAIIGLFTMNQPKVEVAMGADLIEKPVVEATDDSWTNIVASEIDTGVDTIISKKEVIPATTTEDGGTTEPYSKVEFSYKEEDMTVTVDFVGYNNCLDGMWGTSTVAFCTEFHKNQINKNAQWAREAKDGRDKESIIGKEALTTKDL